jgi:hypothetical protein
MLVDSGRKKIGEVQKIVSFSPDGLMLPDRNMA